MGGWRRKAKFGGGGSSAVLLAPKLSAAEKARAEKEAVGRRCLATAAPLDEAGARLCLAACAAARMRAKEHALLVAEKPAGANAQTSERGAVVWRGTSYVWRDEAWQEERQPPTCILVRFDGSAAKAMKK
jgi:hypothetical protein